MTTATEIAVRHRFHRLNMQVSRENPAYEAKSESLSLIRLLDPGVLVDPYILYRALREQSPVIGTSTCTLGWLPAIRKLLPCS
jgi:hypothetical protein